MHEASYEPSTGGLARDRSGMSLIEVLVVVAVFAIVIAGALGYLQAQTRAFYQGSDQMMTLQNLRFAVHRMEMDIQTAGTNLVSGQPSMVYAGDDVVAFNADYATNVASDAFAVFYDPGVPPGQVSVLATSITVPNTSFTYGDTAFADLRSGTPSNAELLMFYFVDDTSTARTDDYMLLRRVNAAPAEVVARNLLAFSGKPFFEYLELSGGGVGTVPAADLPLQHSLKVHGQAADSGSAARIDQIRGVRINLQGTNGLSGDLEHLSEVSRTISMPNVATRVLQICGSEPVLGAVNLSPTHKISAGDDIVEVKWDAATDETGGETDVLRYVLWRRSSSETEWGDPHVSIPAGKSNYTFDDTDVVSGETYRYALAAQDCTPRLSQRVTSGTVSIP